MKKFYFRYIVHVNFLKYFTYQLSISYQTINILQAELDHDASVGCLSVNEKKSLLVTGTFNGYIYIWDLSSFTLLGQHQCELFFLFSITKSLLIYLYYLLIQVIYIVFSVHNLK